MDYSSIIAFNDENALASAIMIAYYTARRDYILVREFPSGRGFADIAFIPRKNSDKPPMIVELKWDRSAESAIDQIKAKNYTGKLIQYSGQILLVGISYNKSTDKVSCIIERELSIESSTQ